jgi:hypothetical protein
VRYRNDLLGRHRLAEHVSLAPGWHRFRLAFRFDEEGFEPWGWEWLAEASASPLFQNIAYLGVTAKMDPGPAGGPSQGGCVCRVESLKGTAKVKKSDGTKQPLKAGDTVKDGEDIYNGFNSAVKLVCNQEPPPPVGPPQMRQVTVKSGADWRVDCAAVMAGPADQTFEIKPDYRELKVGVKKTEIGVDMKVKPANAVTSKSG